tara:strand:- start:544 stop:687 length:144 start_codon:yes stop_codon:yes gene_type:complete
MDSDFYYVRYLELESEMELAKSQIRKLKKENEELRSKTKDNLVKKGL